jgi:hypothetical protein
MTLVLEQSGFRKGIGVHAENLLKMLPDKEQCRIYTEGRGEADPEVIYTNQL